MFKLKLLVLGISVVLGVATAVIAVMLSAKAMHWFNTLTASEQRYFTYPLVLLIVLLSVVSGWRMWRRAKDKPAA
jgi:H+/Cl- antiporter ClcA